jgi:nucleoside-diphosphate-sugar epimerase
MRNERVLVTGATGFVGRALVKQLLADGVSVTAFVREKAGRQGGDGLPAEIEVREVDLRYAAGVKRAIDSIKPTMVLHLAAVGVTDPFLPIGEALRGNLEATINLLKGVQGCCRVVVARTPGELSLMNPYAASKAAAWQFAQMFNRTEGWPIVGAMLFQVYGPGQPGRTVLGAAFRAAQAGESFAMTSGDQRRDWIYIDDAVDGLRAIGPATQLDGETVEIGTGRATPVREVIEKLFAIVGRGQPLIGALPQRPGEVLEQKADANRTERLTGWRAKIDIEEGLKRLSASY